MELHEKLQELRKQRGMTQEQLAEQLFVSRTAVSKWESGRGYPSIDSLKSIAALFGITIDELLSGKEWFSVAEEDVKQTERRIRDVVFGLLDVSAAMLWFLPFFAQRSDNMVQAVSLLSLMAVSPFMRMLYVGLSAALVLLGILTLTLQGCHHPFWRKNKRRLSLYLALIATSVLIVGLQPYAAILLFFFLIIKIAILIKRE